MKKRVVSVLLLPIMLLSVMFTLSGCGATLKSTDKKEGLNYINNKYSKTMYKSRNIQKAFYVYDKNIDYRIMLSDGKSILKINNDFYDDIQAEQLKSDFEKYFVEKILNTDYSRNEMSIFTEYDTRITDYKIYNESLSVFRNYYDGNIENYIKNNKIIVEGKVVVWCKENEIEEKYKEIENRINKLNINLKEYSIVFVDSSLKSNYESVENIYKLKHNFTQDGVFYIMKITDGKPVKYTNIANGFGITLYEAPDFELMIGDISLINDTPTKNELNAISEKKYGIVEYDSSYNMNIEPTYRIQFSDRVIQYLKNNQRDYLDVRYINNNYRDSSVLHISNDNNFSSVSHLRESKLYNKDLLYTELTSYYISK